MDYANLPLGLRVQTQIPLDVKEYALSESALANLGPSNNLAYTYTQGLVVYAVAEKTRWEWREAQLAEVGLMPTNFVYPNGIITFGINYSNRAFNFFPYSSGGNAPTPPFEKADEGSGEGIFIRGRDGSKFDPIGEDAFDVSTATFPGRGATGSNSFASGSDILVSGYAAGTIGYFSENSSQFGFLNGVNSQIAGYATAGFGMGHQVSSINTFVIGQAANIINNSLVDINAFPLKELLVVGNGTIQNNDEFYGVLTRSDAFIVRQNGVATLPSVTNALIDAEPTGKALVTREYLGADTPFRKIDEGNGLGIIIKGRDPLNYGNVGLNAIDFSYSTTVSASQGATGQYAFSSGQDNTSSGYASYSEGVGNFSSNVSSHAEGSGNVASGYGAHAEGVFTVAGQNSAHAQGSNTQALGVSSHAGGESCIANGAYSFASGIRNTVNSYGGFNIGHWSTTVSGDNNVVVATDRVFNVGTGINNGDRRDGFSIFNNGLGTLPTVTNALITADLTGKAIVTKEYLNSVITPTVNLQKTITGDYLLLDSDHDYVIFIDNGATPITITLNAIVTKPSFQVGFIQEGTGDVSFATAGVTLFNPIGLKIKGQGYQAFIERKLSTTTFYLLGNTKS